MEILVNEYVEIVKQELLKYMCKEIDDFYVEETMNLFIDMCCCNVSFKEIKEIILDDIISYFYIYNRYEEFYGLFYNFYVEVMYLLSL